MAKEGVITAAYRAACATYEFDTHCVHGVLYSVGWAAVALPCDPVLPHL